MSKVCEHDARFDLSGCGKSTMQGWRQPLASRRAKSAMIRRVRAKAMCAPVQIPAIRATMGRRILIDCFLNWRPYNQSPSNRSRKLGMLWLCRPAVCGCVHWSACPWNPSRTPWAFVAYSGKRTNRENSGCANHRHLRRRRSNGGFNPGSRQLVRCTGEWKPPIMMRADFEVRNVVRSATVVRTARHFWSGDLAWAWR